MNKLDLVEVSKDKGQTWSVWAFHGYDGDCSAVCRGIFERVSRLYPEWSFRLVINANTSDPKSANWYCFALVNGEVIAKAFPSRDQALAHKDASRHSNATKLAVSVSRFTPETAVQVISDCWAVRAVTFA